MLRRRRHAIRPAQHIADPYLRQAADGRNVASRNKPDIFGFAAVDFANLGHLLLHALRGIDDGVPVADRPLVEADVRHSPHGLVPLDLEHHGRKRLLRRAARPRQIIKDRFHQLLDTEPFAGGADQQRKSLPLPRIPLQGCFHLVRLDGRAFDVAREHPLVELR